MASSPAVPSTAPRSWQSRLATGALLFLLIAIYLVAFEPHLDGHRHNLGGDYWHFLPRMMADHYWFTINGWHAIPWFSPAFCAGFPVWGNPQSMAYSVPEALLNLVDPVYALQVTLAVEASAGLIGVWLLLRSGFGASREASLLGATLFLFNGFFVCRMDAGHVAMHPFMLAPLVGWLVVRPRQHAVDLALDALIGGVLVTVMIQGGMTVLLPPVCLAWLTVGLLHAARGGNSKAFFLRLSGALVIGALLSASKLVAISAVVGNFPRNQYPLPGYRTLVGLATAAFHSLFWRPTTAGDAEMVDALIKVLPFERDYGLSPAPLLILIAAAFFRPASARPRRWWFALFVAALLTPLALNLHGDGWSAFLKHVPIIKSSTSLYRYFVVYVAMLPVLAGLALDRLPRRAFVASGAMLLAVAWSITGGGHHYPDKEYRATNMVQAWNELHAGATIPAISYMDLVLTPDGRPQLVTGADDVFTAGASNVFCYEPLYGYGLEAFPWKPLRMGLALDEADGLLNVKNPICDLYPAENHCKPGDHFLASQRAEAEAFLSWSPIPFERPWRQTAADRLNIAALALTPIAVGWLFILSRRRAKNAA